MTRTVLVSLLFLALLSPVDRAGAGSDARDMEGTWRPLSAEFAGEKWPQKVLDTMKLTMEDGKYSVEVGGRSDEGTVTCDPAKSPRAMDIKGTNGPNKGKTFLVIYELKGDELRVCYDLSGQSRPTEFATKARTQLFLVTYRKEKP
jgi:uncharacterized protein (TIGR03067 family)